MEKEQLIKMSSAIQGNAELTEMFKNNKIEEMHLEKDSISLYVSNQCNLADTNKIMKNIFLLFVDLQVYTVSIDINFLQIIIK